MKSDEIKKAINNIQLDEHSKIRILNKLSIKVNKESGGFIMKMNKKLIGSALVATLALSGFIYVSNGTNNLTINISPEGTSQQKNEYLAITGTITDLLPADGTIDNGVIIKVSATQKDGADYSEVSAYIHASTNIFEINKDELLQINDLKIGQEVSVFYDGTEIESGKISALRVDIKN